MKTVLVLALLSLAALAGCSTLDASYLGVRTGTARYSISFVGSSNRVSASGTATVRQLGLSFSAGGWVEETETTNDLPRAVALETGPRGATLASSGLAWRQTGERDEVVLFALKRVFRLIDFRPEDAGAATVEVRVGRAPSAEDPSGLYVVRFQSATGRSARVQLVLRPDKGLASAEATTEAGSWKLRLEPEPPG